MFNLQRRRHDGFDRVHSVFRFVKDDGLSDFNSDGVTIKYMVTPTFEVENASNGVTISWNLVNGAAKYRVFKKVKGAWKALGDTAATSFTDTAVVSGETYTYTIRCINAAGTAYTSDFNTNGKTITFR